MPAPTFVPLPTYREYAPEDMRRRAADFRAELERRRTARSTFPETRSFREHS